MNRTHIDLFAGIGGFSIASNRNGYKTIAFVENEPYCQELLKLRFGATLITDTDKRKGRSGDESKPAKAELSQSGSDSTDNAPHLYSDIRDFNGAEYAGATLITGGFPCQSFSHAGKRKGSADDRYLWPEMFRVIREVHPQYVIAENVPGLVSIEDGMVFEQVCTDLESEGYAVQSYLIPACGKNAPHKRERIWIVGHSGREGLQGDKGKLGRDPAIITGSDSHAPDTNKLRLQEQRTEQQAGGDRPDDQATADTKGKGLEGRNTEGTGCSRGRTTEHPDSDRRNNQADPWDIPWIEVATEFCRVDARLSPGVDRPKLSKAGHRVARLKALGNSIVPQVAYELIRAIIGGNQ